MKKNPDRVVDIAFLVVTSFMIVLCLRDARNGYLLNHPSTNQTVSVTQEVEQAVILKGPPVIVSEYPKVEPELPKEFLSTNTLPTNELLMLNEIQVQDQLLIWLNQLDK